jgi:hypothetical protein
MCWRRSVRDWQAAAWRCIRRKRRSSIVRYEIRSWELKRCATESLEEVSARINPVVRGWINYYGRYCRSALSPILRQVEMALPGWAMRKFKTLHRRRVESFRWLVRARRPPILLLIGLSSVQTAEQQEPCESRGSRTVL